MIINASSIGDTQIHPRWQMKHRGLHLVSTRPMCLSEGRLAGEDELRQWARESRRMRMGAIAMGAALGSVVWFGRALMMHMGLL